MKMLCLLLCSERYYLEKSNIYGISGILYQWKFLCCSSNSIWWTKSQHFVESCRGKFAESWVQLNGLHHWNSRWCVCCHWPHKSTREACWNPSDFFSFKFLFVNIFLDEGYNKSFSKSVLYLNFVVVLILIALLQKIVKLLKLSYIKSTGRLAFYQQISLRHSQELIWYLSSTNKFFFSWVIIVTA